MRSLQSASSQTLHANGGRVVPPSPEQRILDVGVTSLRRATSGEDASRATSRVQSVRKLIRGVLRITNRRRENAGLKPLKMNRKLKKAAQAHTEDMVANNFFSHTGSDGSSLGDRLRRANYSYSYAAENIAAGSATAKGVMKQWMNSPGHRANILNPNIKHIGIGYQPGGAYGHYWTQKFANPMR
jgi:uncharacterized protein YkwD